MDWVHCNNCFFLPAMGKRFYLTSCGHIYCADCIGECATDHCKLCGNPCSSIPLSSQMKPDVEMYFTDPLELLKKYLKEVQKVAEFQNSHRTRLFAYQREMAKKTQILKDEFKKAQAKFKESESERQRLKDHVDCMKQMINMNQFGGSEMPMSSKSDRHHNTPPSYLQQGDAFQDITPLSNWSQGSASLLRNRSGGSTTSQFPAMPARVSMRTPPINGKLGIIPMTPVSSGINMPNFRLTNQRSRLDETPNVNKNVFMSPMSVSPCSSISSMVSQDLSRVADHSGPLPYRDSQSFRSGGKSGARSCSNLIRQIKLPHDMKNYGSLKTLAVPPYSPETPDQKKV